MSSSKGKVQEIRYSWWAGWNCQRSKTYYVIQCLQQKTKAIAPRLH